MASQSYKSMVPRVFPLLMVMSSLSLSACMAPQRSVEDVSAGIEARLAEGPHHATSGGAASKSGHPKTFAAALRGAVLSNDGYRAALAYEAEAMAGIDVARSAQAVQVSANATLGAQHEGPPVSKVTRGVAGDLSVSKLLYDGNGSVGAIDEATAGALAAQSRRLERANNIALDAATAWVDLWLASTRLRLLNQKTAQLDKLIGQMDRMVENGMLDRGKYESVKRQVLDIELERSSVRADRAEATKNFRRYFGSTWAQPSAPANIVTDRIMRDRATAWKTAPRLRQGAAELAAARGALIQAQAAFKPSIQMRAGVTSPMSQNDSTDVTAGLVLHYQFTDGGRRKARLQAAEQRVEALDANLSDEQLGAKVAMTTAQHKLATLAKSLPLVNEKIRLSSSEVELARSQLMTGQTGLQQLFAAELENYRAQDRRAELRAEMHILKLTIAAQSGYLTDLIGLEQ